MKRKVSVVRAVLLVLLLVSYAWSADVDKTLYFPHVASDGVWDTDICLVNPGNSEVAVKLYAFDDDGISLGSALDVTLPAHGRYELIVSVAFTQAKSIKYMTAVSQSAELVGYLKFYVNNKYRVALPAVYANNYGVMYVPHVASDSSWWTGLGLVNTTINAKTVNISFSDGQQTSVVIPAYGHKAFTVRSLFGGQPQPQINSAIIESGTGIVGLQLFGSGDQLSGCKLQSSTAGSLYFPHLVNDSKWWTGIAAYNTGGDNVTVEIFPYSADGTILGYSKMMMNSREKYIGLVSALNLPPGTAWFRMQASAGLTGLELFGTSDKKELAGYSCVNIDKISGVFPKFNQDGWTGIAFVNTSPSSTTVVLKAYRDDGVLISTANISLGGHCKVVKYAPDFYDDDISGANYLSFSSSTPIVGFQLNGSIDETMLDALPGM